MQRETYRPDQFKPDEIVVDPTNIFKTNGEVHRDFRPDYTDEVNSGAVASSPSHKSNSSPWRVRGDLGDLSERGKPANGNRWPNLSRTAIITPAQEEFPRNA